MRHVRMLGLCLIAVFVVAAVAASSALAGPEWGKCEAKAGGNYKNSNCTEKAKPKGSGSYEWRKASEVATKRVAEGKSPGVPFTGASIVGSGGVLYGDLEECRAQIEEPFLAGESYPGRYTRKACGEKVYEYEGVKATAQRHRGALGKIECAGETNAGETEGKNKLANIKVVFTGCKLFGAVPCTSSGANEGEVVVNTLKGELGYINKAEHKVGVLLEPVKKHGTFAEFVCNGVLGVVVGVGNSKEGAAWSSTGCVGAECPSTITPEQEKHGGYDGIISPITPVDQITSTYEQIFTVHQDENYQVWNEPKNLEGKHIDVLETYQFSAAEPANSTVWGAAGEEVTNVNTSSEEGEIKA